MNCVIHEWQRTFVLELKELKIEGGECENNAEITL